MKPLISATPKALTIDINLLTINEIQNIINKLPKEAFLCLNSEPCPHLSWDGNITTCAIHHYKWYKETPCYDHGQIEMSKDEPCRTGVWMRENKINVKEVFGKKNKTLKKLKE